MYNLWCCVHTKVAMQQHASKGLEGFLQGRSRRALRRCLVIGVRKGGKLMRRVSTSVIRCRTSQNSDHENLLDL